MYKYTVLLNNIAENLTEYQSKVITFLFIVGIIFLIRFFLFKWLSKNIVSINRKTTWRKVTNYITTFIILIIIAKIWLKFDSVLTFFGLISAAITIVSKELILNIISSGVIFWRSLFDIGDRIEINHYIGDVVDIGILYFTIAEVGNWVSAENSTGRVIKVPNMLVLTNNVINYHKGLNKIWNEIHIVITNDSNWKKSEKLLNEVIKNNVKIYTEEEINSIKDNTFIGVHYSNFNPNIYVSLLEEGGIRFSIRYLCKPRMRRESEQSIWFNILESFEAHEDIKIYSKH